MQPNSLLKKVSNQPGKNLPQGWEWFLAKDICSKVQSGSTPKGKQFTETGEVPYLKVYNIVNQEIDFDYRPQFISKEIHVEKLTRSITFPNDVLMNIVGPPLGKVALVTQQYSEWNMNQALVLFRPHQGLLNLYLYYYLVGGEFVREILADTKGSVGQINISLTQCRNCPIPLPPLNEQRRIVAKIEALTARSRKAREALDAIPALLDQFRQSVLAAAFRGDLTADWREQNPDVEPAEKLLERIRAERWERWEKDLLNKGKDPLKSKYKFPAQLNVDNLPNLPNLWTWASLDQLLFSLKNGLPRKPADELPGIPILRISALRPLAVDVDDIRFYRPQINEDVNPYLLKSGDLLFTRYNGNREFVGICGLVRNLSTKLLHPDKLIRGQIVSTSLCLPEYLEIACNTELSRLHIDSHIKTSAGQHGISGGDLKTTPVPIPPISEQMAIVKIVENHFSIIKKLESLTDSYKEDFQFLDQSILAKAFRGELVPQDPNDEPASVLLESIQAERAKLNGKAKTRTKKKK